MHSSVPEESSSPQPEANPATDAASPATPRPTLDRIFFGSDGPRAIWGIAIFLALRQLLPYLIYPLFQSTFSPSTTWTGSIPLRTVSVFEAAGLVSIALTTWLMARLERRPFAAYGFNPPHGLRNFFAGLGWGVMLLSLLVVILHATGLLAFDARLLYGTDTLRYGAMWLGAFLLVAFREELVSRAYLQFTLTRGLREVLQRPLGPARANVAGFWIAALILSFVFGYSHLSNKLESPLGLLSAGLIGLTFCLSLWRTGSLWWAIGFHASWDWAQSFLYGVPDSGLMARWRLMSSHTVGRPILSGGLTGPEGSVFILPTVGLIVAVVILTLPRTHFGYIPADNPGPSLD